MAERIFRYKKKYVNEVDLKYFDEATKRRYRLDVVLKTGKSDKSVLVIMMNPSKATKEKSDNTINRVIKYVSRKNGSGALKDVGKVIFTNLYVAYQTVPNEVNKLIKEHGQEFIKGIEEGARYNNDEVIRIAKEDEAAVILVAWGKGGIEGYRTRIQEVLSLIQDEVLYCVKGPTKKGHPRHPRNWSYSWPVVEFVKK